MESVAAAPILRQRLPKFRVRVVNVVDLMTLPRPKDHPHGMSEVQFTDTVDVVFAFDGYAGAVHQLVHGRPDVDRFRVRGFIEEDTTTIPFDMTVRNRVDGGYPPGGGRGARSQRCGAAIRRFLRAGRHRRPGRRREAADAGPEVARPVAGRRRRADHDHRATRLSNAKAKRELGWPLRYPSWRQGFKEELA